MPPRARKDQHGLGRAIINKQAKDARNAKESDLYTTDLDSTSRLKSVTQERDLDEFLNTAQLAATDFTAEKENIRIIQSPSLNASSAHNPFLLTAQEERDALRRHQENKDKLRVPRRPPWTRDLTTAQLERQERDAFLDWRRSLAQLVEENNFLLTPFERNIEVWRQLWRVLERSHLVVQIVDARNPLNFRCEDLEAYVLDIHRLQDESDSAASNFRRKNLLLINKADLLTKDQRRQWADYFDEQGITYAFFSAANAAALQEARREAEGQGDAQGNEEDAEDEHEVLDDEADSASSDYESLEEADETIYFSAEEGQEEANSEDSRTRVLTVLELEDLFIKTAPEPPLEGDRSAKLTIGLVGYPNVGKSSTINALIGEKKVSVSATPGKTKHFQTINLSPNLVLCDCPGLVFPQFAAQKAELVCDGVLPVDQLREFHGPVGLVTKRIGREVLEATYGLSIRRRDEEADVQSDDVSAEDLLIAYAIARGFARSGQGNPDESRAARYVLKDYVNAKLLFCHPPPGISEAEFNAPTKQNVVRALERAGKKKAPVTRVGKDADTFMPTDHTALKENGGGQKSRAVDASFFGSGLSARPFVQGQAFSRSKKYPHQNAVTDDGSAIPGRTARLMTVLANAPVGGMGSQGKKHHKGNKRVKQRSGKGYD